MNTHGFLIKMSLTSGIYNNFNNSPISGRKMSTIPAINDIEITVMVNFFGHQYRLFNCLMLLIAIGRQIPLGLNVSDGCCKSQHCNQ